MSRGNDAHLRLRREVNARRVPRWGAGVVDSLDSRRGAASCLATIVLPPSPSTGKVTGQTRMLFFRHAGKTSSIPPPVCGLTAAIVVVARRRKEYHVVAAVEGHELETPETELRPRLERLLETPHLELDRKLFVNTQQAPTWPTNYQCFDPEGSLDRRVNCCCVSQPRWIGARQRHKGGKQ
jgi:signal transduction histidine kinase